MKATRINLILLLVVTISVIVLAVVYRRAPDKQPSSNDLRNVTRPERGLVWVSPDGRHALVHSLEENGGVFLYEVVSNQILRHFEQYEAPATGDPWSGNSKRFILIHQQERTTTYEVFNTEGEPIVWLTLSQQPGFRAVVSPDARYVAAALPPQPETSGSVLVWDTQLHAHQIVPFDADVQQIAWVEPHQIIVRLGTKTSDLYLMDTGTLKPRLLLRSKHPVELALSLLRDGRLPLIVHQRQQDMLALLEVAQARLETVGTLPKTDVARDFRWRLSNTSETNKLFLWHWVERCNAEVIAYDYTRRRALGNVPLPCPFTPSVDRQGRIWGWGSGRKLEQLGSL